MKRSLRTILATSLAVCAALACAAAVSRAAESSPATKAPQASPEVQVSSTSDWLARWEGHITSDARNRYCDRETGEELGWLVSPFLNGFYYGYLATGDTKWIDMLVDWSDAVIRRAQKEPDGCLGWPKDAGASTSAVEEFYTDNELGEAMALEPMVLMAGVIRKDASLKEKYGRKAEEYLALSEKIFEKWDSRGAWREVRGGGVWVVPPFGIDKKSGGWTPGYARRATDGFTLPANKQNLIAEWLTAMYDVTGKSVYRDRAEKWWGVMKSRMKSRDSGKFFVWDYWDPAGPWDYKPDGTTRHWVGVHPNGGYYAIDVEGIVTAYEHNLVFKKDDIDRLIATNRDFMWDGQIHGARFRRIDGGEPDKRWADSPGVLWTALVPYDARLREVFEANHDPASWGGLAETPRYLALLAADHAPRYHDGLGIQGSIDHRRGEMYPVKVSDNHRYFVDQEGKPVFWLGTTQWQLFREYSLDDVTTIVDKSVANGFVFAQVMLLGVGDGTQANIEGEKPWINNDPLTPNEAFFKHVDAVMEIARKRNFIISMTLYHQRYRPYITDEKARAWAKWVASRYKDFPNIVWSMTPEAKPDFVGVIRELAAGIREGDGGRHLITFKPDPAPHGPGFLHDEPWLDFSAMQVWKWIETIYSMVTTEYNLKPTKPVVMGEGAYEQGSEYGFDVTPLWIRRQAYYSYLSGAHHAYGHNDSWRVLPTWKKALDAPGAAQMGLLKKIFTQRQEWWYLVPDQSVLAKGGRTEGQVLTLSARHKDGKWAIVYCADKASFTVDMTKVAGKEASVLWIDPRTAKETAVGRMATSGTHDFSTPEGWEDALLVIETAG